MLRTTASWFVATTLLIVTGCADDDLEDRSGPKSEPPTAALVASPLVGVVPLAVVLDASASTDDVTLPENLEYRFDVDGDEIWDTDWLSSPTFEGTIEIAGVFKPAVIVRDEDRLETIASLEESIKALAVPERGELELTVVGDFNYDGIVSDLDEAIEGRGEPLAPIIFGPNLDDDDGDTRRDGIDEVVNGAGDAEDLTPLTVPAIRGFDPEEHRVVARLSPESARDWIRIFSAEPEYTPLLRVGDPEAVLLLDFREQQRVLLEGIIGRFVGFDGRVSLSLELQDSQGTILDEAQIELQGAPVIFPPDTQDATTFFVVDLPGGPENNGAFMQSLREFMPADIDFQALNGNVYGGDRWVQDSMQTAYFSRPGRDGPEVSTLHMQTNRGSGLQLFLPNEWLSPERGYVAPRGNESSLNYGGNLEVIPPHSSPIGTFPMGRIVVGGGSGGTLDGLEHSDQMTPAQLEFMNAQGVQGPVLEVSSEWLAVGHIDEIFVFLPRKIPLDGAKDFFVVLASPTLATQELESLAERGLGDLVIFEGRDAQTTVADILGDDSLMEYQTKAQARIDSVREDLVGAIGLADIDIVEVPVLYESMWFGKDFAVAYNPGIQNLVAANDVLFVPDPEGPVDPEDGRGVWRRATRDALEATGHQVEFVDVFESYHELMGEAHCGTNFERRPFETQWWEVMP